jgi:hypothetical protein
MNTFSQSGASSGVPSISDLDGYTIRDYSFTGNNSYFPADTDEFGFDPPEERGAYGKLQQQLSPADSTASPMSDWPDFEDRDHERKQKGFDNAHPLDRMMIDSLPNPATALSRYGQVTPPRTDSTGSIETVKHGSQSPMSKGSERPRRKTKTKEAELPPATASGRKKKTSKKAAANIEANNTAEDSKRKASLEKNRLAAAKCRVNKKEKTEQLQRDSHDKAVHNAYLRSQIASMSEEVRQLNTILLAHASCEGCKSPEEIQKHLQQLGADFLPGFGNMQVDGLPQVSGQLPGYFDMPTSDSSMLNPPLPDFDRSGDFEVHTPMQAD